MAIILLVFVVVVLGLLASASIRVVQQYQRGVHFRLGRVIGVREPGLRLIIPIIDRLWRVSMRIVTMPIQSQGIITRDNVSVDIAALLTSASPMRANPYAFSADADWRHGQT